MIFLSGLLDAHATVGKGRVSGTIDRWEYKHTIAADAIFDTQLKMVVFLCSHPSYIYCLL
jgi:hypothetical protein